MAKLRKCNFLQTFPGHDSDEERKEGYFHRFGEYILVDEDRPQTYAIIEDLEGIVHFVDIYDFDFTNHPPNPKDIE